MAVRSTDRKSMSSSAAATSFWPTHHEELLLTAALARPEAAVAAWKEVRPGLDIETMTTEGMTLLPLVYGNLTRAGHDDPDLPRLKGVYRHTWARNNFLLGELSRSVADLRHNGVGAIALKGVALLLLYYPDVATRPMADVDILVRPRDIGTALEVLGAARAVTDQLGDGRLPRFLHGVEVQTESGMKIDVHWRLTDYDSGDRSLDEIWRRAIPVRIGDAPALALGPEQLLLHVCSHGMTAVPTRTLRWIADCVMVINGTPRPVDWTRLVELSAQQGSSLPMRDALTYLRDRFDVRVPRDVIASLDGAPRSRREELGYSATARPPRGPEPLKTAMTVAAHYTRLTAAMPVRKAIGSFPSFLQESWRLGRRRDLPRAFASRVWTRLRRS